MHKKLGRFRGFLKRNKQVLSFLSALVVLMSFTLKEELNEYLKDELKRFSDTLTQLTKQEDEDFAVRLNRELNQKLDRLERAIANKKRSDEEEWKDVTDSERMAHDQTISYRSDLIRSMVDRLKRGRYFLGKTDELTAKSDGAYNKLATLLQPDHKLEEADIGTARNLLATLYDVESGISGLETEARADLLSSKEEIERQLILTKWGVYSLFILGWSLGLALSLIGEHAKSE